MNEKNSAISTPFLTELEFTEPARVFECFAAEPWSVLFESAGLPGNPPGTNRYSYIAIKPFLKIIHDPATATNDLFITLRELCSEYSLDTIEDLPPFQGGMIGLLPYDLCEQLYDIRDDAMSQHTCSIAYIGCYDLVHAFDHELQKSWLFSSGLPYLESAARARQALMQQQYYLQACKQRSIRNKKSFQLTTPLTSNFTRQTYHDAVNVAKTYIRAGDIFEINIAQQFRAKIAADSDPYLLYKKITALNPSPFSAFAQYDNTTIISASPECFLKVSNGHVETRPIKGTRKRSVDPEEDSRLIASLLSSQKDCAENIMIVDLMRNDLSRVCEPDSVVVTQLCGHEVYPHVHHLVSAIEGQLKKDSTVFDLLQAAFPGGSITGTPKIRAMQLIASIEKTKRGPYCGNLFMASFNGLQMESSILIRTYVLQNDEIRFHGGGAITLDSDAADEYEETLSKVAVLKKALEETSCDFY